MNAHVQHIFDSIEVSLAASRSELANVELAIADLKASRERFSKNSSLSRDLLGFINQLTNFKEVLVLKIDRDHEEKSSLIEEITGDQS